ncbi:MAG: DNA polymerase X family [Candidatus Carbobacillus altaicus]|uniref:DNA polymerase X family n=1 Tax=Candidatus Carbonibacillus altaicus TaxID=2163959 RepID=A0A2R6Y4F9_9BACL|nr:MAG: DNA polymerase X family [Candidatus Carbobacillus altaicus]
MDNQRIAQILEEMADLSEIIGDNTFKIQAYRRAAETIFRLNEPIQEVWARGESIPGIGKGIRTLIEAITPDGESPELVRLRAEVPAELIKLTRIPGIGPKTVGRLWQALGVRTLEEVKQAAKEQKIRAIKGVGAKTEMLLLRGIEKAEMPKERWPLIEALSISEEICARLRDYPEVKRCEVAGSIRRARELVKDIDLVVMTEAAPAVAERLKTFPGNIEVVAWGEEKISFRYASLQPIAVDVRLFSPEQFASGLVHFTGSKEHNVFLRQRAKEKGWKLSEYGLEDERTGEIQTFEQEEALYAALSIPYFTPELRDTEVVGGDAFWKAATAASLEALIKQEDIQGDLHMHTTASDGGDSIEAMARAAKKMGYRYIAVTDHSQSLKVARGLTVEQLLQHMEAIRTVEEKLSNEWGEPFYILRGAEVDILPDGTLDYPDEILERLDLVIASVHTSFKQSNEEMTARILRAARHPFVDIIAHPTGRLIGRREAYGLDVGKLIEQAAVSGVVLELNSYPERLDLSPSYLRLAQEAGVQLAINTDAHHTDGLAWMALGVKIARKALLRPAQVINTWPPEKLFQFLARHRKHWRKR